MEIKECADLHINVVAITSGHIFYFGITELFSKFNAHIAH